MIQLIIAAIALLLAFVLLKNIFIVAFKIFSYGFKFVFFAFMLPAAIPGGVLLKIMGPSKIILFLLAATSLLITTGMITSSSTEFDYLRRYTFINELYSLTPQRELVDFSALKFIASSILISTLTLLNFNSEKIKSPSFSENIYIAFFLFLISIYFYDLPFTIPVNTVTKQCIESSYWFASIILTILAPATKKGTQEAEEAEEAEEKLDQKTENEKYLNQRVYVEERPDEKTQSHTTETFRNQFEIKNKTQTGEDNIHLDENVFSDLEDKLNDDSSIYTGWESLKNPSSKGYKKLHAAMESYNESSYDAILLIDTTVLGSAKEGICINNSCIRAKNDEGRHIFYYSEIKNIRIDEDDQEIVINSKTFKYYDSKLTQSLKEIAKILKAHLEKQGEIR